MKTPKLIVIGSGLAGLLVARLVAERHPVLVLTKSSMFDSNTSWSQGGIAATWAKEDSVELHSYDTLEAGNGLCVPEAVHVLTSNSRNAVEQLISLGTRFDMGANHTFELGMEGAHSIKRILHAGGDATGQEIQRALVQSVIDHPNVEIVQHAQVAEMLVSQNRVRGIRYLVGKQAMLAVAECDQLVLASGGAGQLYKHTSNPSVATGDGVTMAYAAGAELMDLEFFQFHPTGLDLQGAPNFLITEALRGEGAVLLNSLNDRFMLKEHPSHELAPRDIVARAIARQMMETGNGKVWLDATHLAPDFLQSRFPTIYQTCKKYGLDICHDRIPVTPVAHYMIGGVATDLWGRTTVAGLYACGEVARTGVHGANRLASNSLLEASVFAIRVAQVMERDEMQTPLLWDEYPQQPHHGNLATSAECRPTTNDSMTRGQFRQLMWENVGLIRSETSLKRVIKALQNCPLPDPLTHDYASFELQSMKMLGRLIAESALERRESRGAHFRTDYPEANTKSIAYTRVRRFPVN